MVALCHHSAAAQPLPERTALTEQPIVARVAPLPESVCAVVLALAPDVVQVLDPGTTGGCPRAARDRRLHQFVVDPAVRVALVQRLAWLVDRPELLHVV